MPRNNKPRPPYKRPDDVSSEFPEGAIKLFTRLLPASDDGEAERVLIEGDRLSLEYLSKMILAQAAFPLDCSYAISPKSAGSAFFGRRAKLGFIIHRLPCMNPKPKAAKKLAKRKKLPEK
jgi:hypothetical protein